MQVLYQCDVAAVSVETALRHYWSSFGEGREGRAFVERLVRGVGTERDALDVLITTHCHHWRIARMSVVDRNLLRLAAYELQRLPEVPTRVILNEAVELAKTFGDAQSPAFVNGILDKIAAVVRAIPTDPSAPGAPAVRE